MSSVLTGGGIYNGTRNVHTRDTARMERFFIRLIIFLTAVIILEILFHFFIAPSLMIKKIEIVSGPGLGLSKEEILSVSGIHENMNYFDVRISVIEDRLLSVPSVKAVHVRKVFPSTLVVKISPRVPVGICLVNSGSGVIPVAVDSDGVLFPFGGGDGESADYPVISGISIPYVKKGARLPKPLGSFLKDMDTVRNLSPQLFSLISEVKFVKKDGMDYDVILYPATSRVRVRIGNGLDIKMLRYIMMILDVISMQPAMDNLEEIDLRTGEAVYRIRGE